MFQYFQKERRKKICKDVELELCPILPKLNDLCKEEYIRLENSSVIDALCKQIYTQEKTIARLVVNEKELYVTYTNNSVFHIRFCDLGVRNLSYKEFNDPDLRGKWNLLLTDAAKTANAQVSYVEFCHLCSKIYRYGEDYAWSPGFDEVKAVAHIIAKKSGMSFQGPTFREQSPNYYVEDVVFDAPPLPEW